jgi:hypothetical protein
MPDKEEVMKQMDDAAKLAGEEFEKNYEKWSAKDVVGWWSGWYLQAGHKRLGRMLVARAKKEKA